MRRALTFAGMSAAHAATDMAHDARTSSPRIFFEARIVSLEFDPGIEEEVSPDHIEADRLRVEHARADESRCERWVLVQHVVDTEHHVRLARALALPTHRQVVHDIG